MQNECAELRLEAKDLIRNCRDCEVDCLLWPGELSRQLYNCKHQQIWHLISDKLTGKLERLGHWARGRRRVDALRPPVATEASRPPNEAGQTARPGDTFGTGLREADPSTSLSARHWDSVLSPSLEPDRDFCAPLKLTRTQYHGIWKCDSRRTQTWMLLAKVFSSLGRNSGVGVILFSLFIAAAFDSTRCENRTMIHSTGESELLRGAPNVHLPAPGPTFSKEMILIELEYLHTWLVGSYSTRALHIWWHLPGAVKLQISRVKMDFGGELFFFLLRSVCPVVLSDVVIVGSRRRSSPQRPRRKKIFSWHRCFFSRTIWW